MRSLAVVLAAAAAVRIAFLSAPQLDYDEGVYWESLRAMAAGHPLYQSVYSSQPPGFLLLTLPGFLLGGHTLLGARARLSRFSRWVCRSVPGLPCAAWPALALRSSPRQSAPSIRSSCGAR